MILLEVLIQKSPSAPSVAAGLEVPFKTDFPSEPTKFVPLVGQPLAVLGPKMILLEVLIQKSPSAPSVAAGLGFHLRQIFHLNQPNLFH